jgi:hypothetical protein
MKSQRNTLPKPTIHSHYQNVDCSELNLMRAEVSLSQYYETEQNRIEHSSVMFPINSSLGLITLFDGQKHYPVAKVSVDFLFVEHTQYDCIEIIGTCVPTAVRNNNNNINAATAGG